MTTNRQDRSKTFYWAPQADPGIAEPVAGLLPVVPRGAVELTGDDARAVQEILRQQQEGQLTGDEAQAALGEIVRQQQERQRATEIEPGAPGDEPQAW
jgi:hypothetical protein